MTEPKTKADKEAGLLSKTAQAYLDEFIFSYKYGREKTFSNKYTDKGIEIEDLGIHLLNQVHKKFYKKNTVRYSNNDITGEPDIVDRDIIIDIKTCYDWTTFIAKNEIPKEYYWQLCGYCLLTEKKKGAIAYVLNNTPFHLVENEFVSAFYKNGRQDLSDDEKARIALNHTFSDKWVKDFEVVDGYWEMIKCQFPETDLEFIEIPQEKRLRYYEVEFKQEDFDKLENQIQKAITYIEDNYNRF